MRGRILILTKTLLVLQLLFVVRANAAQGITRRGLLIGSAAATTATILVPSEGLISFLTSSRDKLSADEILHQLIAAVDALNDPSLSIRIRQLVGWEQPLSSKELKILEQLKDKARVPARAKIMFEDMKSAETVLNLDSNWTQLRLIGKKGEEIQTLAKIVRTPMISRLRQHVLEFAKNHSVIRPNDVDELIASNCMHGLTSPDEGEPELIAITKTFAPDEEIQAEIREIGPPRSKTWARE